MKNPSGFIGNRNHEPDNYMVIISTETSRLGTSGKKWAGWKCTNILPGNLAMSHLGGARGHTQEYNIKMNLQGL